MKKRLIAMLMIGFFVLSAENQVNYNPLMTKYLMQKNALGEEKFFLFDVGASRGIAKYWEVFSRNLVGGWIRSFN